MGEVCTYCGRQVEGEGFTYNGEVYCGECRENRFVECASCHKLIPMQSAYQEGFNGKPYCEDCYEDYTYVCDDCGIAFDRRFHGNGVTVRGGNCVCNSCITEYYYCSECDEYVDEEEWDCEEECCTACANSNTDLIRGYHSTKRVFFGELEKAWHNLWRGLGFELEVERGRAPREAERELAIKLYEIAATDRGSRITLERDGSLEKGFEIITMPHTEKEFYKFDWSKILDICKKYGYISHDAGTCGLHIHVSRNYFGADYDRQITAISKVSYFYEKYWQEVLRFSRRTNRQALDWAGRYNANRKGLHKIHKNKSAGRYYAINTTNADTVEFRLGRGTLNAESFYAWIDFNLTLVHNSKKITWSQADNLSLWLRGLKPETEDYLAKKNIFEGVTVCA